MEFIRARMLNDSELDSIYGSRVVEVNQCFTDEDNKIYLQRKNSVLMINTMGGVLSVLHEGYFNVVHGQSFKEIPRSEFDVAAKKFIYENELNELWENKTK